jgi:hypothetical protein
VKPERIYVQWEENGDLEAYAYLDHLEAAEAKHNQYVYMEEEPGWVRRTVATEDEFWEMMRELSSEGYTLLGGAYMSLWRL